MRTKGIYTGITCKRLNKNSKLTRILNFIEDNNGTTKYECVTKVLGKIGTKQELRGYYSCVFYDLIDLGILERGANFKYHITNYGKSILSKI